MQCTSKEGIHKIIRRQIIDRIARKGAETISKNVKSAIAILSFDAALSTSFAGFICSLY